MWYHWITRPQNLLHKVLQCKYKKWCSKTISYLYSVGKKLLTKLWAALNHHNDWKIVAVLSLFCFQVGLRKTNTRAYLHLKSYTKWHQQSYILNTISTVMQGDTLIGYRSDKVHKMWYQSIAREQCILQKVYNWNEITGFPILSFPFSWVWKDCYKNYDSSLKWSNEQK